MQHAAQAFRPFNNLQYYLGLCCKPKQLSFLQFTQRALFAQQTDPIEPASQAEWTEVEISDAVT